MAKFLLGERGAHVEIIDTGHTRKRDLALELPKAPLEAVMSNEVWGEIYERLNRSPRPLPGVQPLVAAIEARGIQWAIATSSRRDQVATSVAALGLEDEPTIVDASHVKHAKPEPDLLLLVAKQLKVEPGRCWYVGDSTWDMVSAVAAAMIAIGVTVGSAVDARALTAAGASTVVRTLVELAEDLRDR